VSVLGLDHVQVAAPAGCEALARWFYGELLGLVEIPKPDVLAARGGAWFRCGLQQLHVGVEEPFLPASKAHPALLVDRGSLAELADRLAADGLRVDWDHSLDPVKRIYSRDPWGNRIELLEASADAG
jgi:catechol 2,3-dioxygenase-like lactoylglutathione lyase family enzyme